MFLEEKANEMTGTLITLVPGLKELTCRMKKRFGVY
jgi:hypothetical protein